jgi:hypothetical protein
VALPGGRTTDGASPIVRVFVVRFLMIAVTGVGSDVGSCADEQSPVGAPSKDVGFIVAVVPNVRG